MIRSRLPAIAVLIAAAVLGTASPASAHTVTGVSPTNFRSEILAVSPADPDVSVELLDLGNRVRLTNRGTSDIMVLGYYDEPYLRVGPSGVYENEQSPTAELNNKVGGGSSTTTSAPTATPPASGWRKTSNGHTAIWRDQRTRWEGAPPAAVKTDPNRARVVGRWSLDLQRGNAPIAVIGLILWQPPPKTTPWLLGALALAGITAALGLLRRWGPLLSAAVAVVIATDIVHTIGNSSAATGGIRAVLGRVLVGGLFNTAAWLVGAWAISALQRQRDAGLYAAIFSMFVIFLFSGLGDTTSLGRSVLPYAWAPLLARAAVMIALGGGLGTGVALGIVLRRTAPPRRPKSVEKLIPTEALS